MITELYPYTTDLPTIKTLLHVVPCKITWKGEVKLAEDKLWNQKLISDCSQKSSLSDVPGSDVTGSDVSHMTGSDPVRK
jgi:hypothetical protein